MQKRTSNGFTLIELLLVIAIVLTLASFSSVFYSRFLTQNAVSNTADQLIGSLRKAQSYSISGKQNSVWGVNFSLNKITLFKGSTYATRTVAFDEIYTTNENISVTGFTEISFAKVTGLPTPSGPTSITISGDSNTSTLIVNEQGVINRQ